jgi:hypothetical protein
VEIDAYFSRTAPYLNGKIERSFKTLRLYWRLILCRNSTASVQRRLNHYRHWYNIHRPHSALGVLTPDEAWRQKPAPTAVPIRARDGAHYHFHVAMRNCRGDPGLPVFQITVRKAA